MVRKRICRKAQPRVGSGAAAQLPARGKKSLQQGSCVLGEEAGGNFDTMVEFGGGEDCKAGTESAAFGIVGSVDKSGDSSLNNGAGAHGAGLERHVEGTIDEAVVTYPFRALANGDNLGMRRGIVIADRTIAGARKDHFILDQDRANRNFTSFCRSLGFGKREPHEVQIVRHREPENNTPATITRRWERKDDPQRSLTTAQARKRLRTWKIRDTSSFTGGLSDAVHPIIHSWKSDEIQSHKVGL
jgi:hypothetical protein